MLKWMLLKKKLMRKPWLLESDRSLSNYEAHRLVLAQGGYPTAASIMEGARIKAGKSLEEWISLTGFQLHSTKNIAKEKIAVKSKRLIIAAISILLIIAFFGFTPRGRALAEEALTTITEFFENIIYIHPIGTSKDDVYQIPVASPGVPDETEIKLNSLEEIPNYINESFLYLKGQRFDVVEVLLTTYSYRNPGFTVQYFMGDCDIALSEQWPTEDQLEVNMGLDGDYFSYSLSNGAVLEGSYFAEDQSFAAAMIYDGLVFSIFADNVPTDIVMYEILDALAWSNND